MNEYKGFKVGDRVKFEQTEEATDFGTIRRFDRDEYAKVRVWVTWESDGREQYVCDVSTLTLAPVEVTFEDMLRWYVEEYRSVNFCCNSVDRGILTIKQYYKAHHEKVPQHLADAKTALENAGYTVTK